MLTFNTTDVETANARRESICQIGLVTVRDGGVVDQWETLVNPEEWFDPLNISIHGIRESDVRHSPTLPEVHGELCARLNGSVLVSHMPFDRIAFERAITRYDLEQLQVRWLDSAMIVRRAWPERYGQRGYGLKDVAKDFGISFRHHNALEDARAAAKVVLHVCAETHTDIDYWLRRVDRPISVSSAVHSSSSTPSVKREGNVEGRLFGETVVFTGALVVPRKKAADMASEFGCNVGENVTRRVTMLVVGTHDKGKLNGYEKSNKHRRAEELIEQGMEIQILSEDDFFALLGIDASRLEK